MLSGRGMAAVLTQPAILALIWLGVVVHSAIIFVQAHARITQWDFSHYYVEAYAMRLGLNPYAMDLRPLGAQLHLEGIARGSYSPFFLLCFEPMTLLSPPAAWWIWFSLNLFALAIALAIIFGQAAALAPTLKSATLALALLYPPLGTHFFYAQSQLIILLLLAIVMRALRKNHDGVAGLALAVAGMLKVFPLLMVGYLIMCRRWRALRWTFVWVGALMMATIGIVGADRTFAFASAAHFVTNVHFILRPANIAVGSFAARLFWYLVDPAAAMVKPERVIVAGAQMLMLAGTVLATRRQAFAGDLNWRAFSLWVITTVELAPTAWIHYLVLLFIPFVFITVDAWNGSGDSRPVELVALSYAVVSAGMLIAPVLRPGSPPRLAIEESAAVSLLIAYVAGFLFVRGGRSEPSRGGRAVQAAESP
jgi:alpha-1,2-mannosyltransferase